MKLAIVTSSYPRFSGDLFGIFVYHLARNLAELGLEIHVLAPGDPPYPREEEWQGVHVYRFRYTPPGIGPALCYGSGILDNLKSDPLLWAQVPTYLVSCLAALRRVARRNAVDAINSQWFVPQGAIAGLVSRELGIPHLATVHAGELSLLSRVPFRRTLSRFVIARSDHLICVSQRSRARLEEVAESPVPAEVVPMGVDTARFSNVSSDSRIDRGDLPRDARTLLYVGRLAEKKGVDYLLEATAKLTGDFDELHLVLVGEGRLRDRIVAKAKQLGLADRVHMTGRVTNTKVADYYRAADVVVIPSVVTEDEDEEGLPVVLLEALATGAIVVATDTGGMPEIVGDGVNGFLATPGEAGSLATAISRALTVEDPATMESAARRSVEAFDWSRIAAYYKAAAVRLIEGESPPRFSQSPVPDTGLT